MTPQCPGAPACTVCFLLAVEPDDHVLRAIYGHLVLSNEELARHADSLIEIERDYAAVEQRIRRWLVPVILEKAELLFSDDPRCLQELRTELAKASAKLN